MTTPRVRFTSGATRPPAEVLNVDYKDVLEQAIANERYRVLRDLRQVIERIETTEPESGHSYRSKPRSAASLKADVLKKLDKAEGASE